jgi:hypothetical protein
MTTNGIEQNNMSEEYNFLVEYGISKKVAQ